MKIQLSFLIISLVLLLGHAIEARGQGTTSFGNYSLTYTLSGDNATITGGSFQTAFDGVLSIPERIDNHPVVAIAASAFTSKTAITALSLPEGLQTIGAKAFQRSAIQGSVLIPSTVQTLGFRAFEFNSGITQVNFADNSQLTSMGDNVFSGTSITSIALPQSLTAIPKEAFLNLPYLKTITWSDKIVSIGASAFKGCGITGDITFPNTLTSLGQSCFNGTQNLGYVYFHEDSPVKYIPPSAFYESSLRNVSLPVGLDSIGSNAYEYCANMDTFTLVLPVNLKSIGSTAFAFWRKKDANGQTTTPVFPGRNKLVFPEGSQLQKIGVGAFRNGNWYGDITLPSGITRIEKEVFLRNEQWAGLITLPSTLTYIGDNAFELVGSTQDLAIPNEVIEIGNEAFFNSPFSGISFLPGAKISKLGARAFKYCFNLSYLDLSNIVNLQALNASREASTANPSQYAYMPKYTMVYLPKGSTIKSGEENFVMDGQCEKFVVYDYDKSGSYHSVNDTIYSGDRRWVGEKNRIVTNEPSPENFGMSRGCDYEIQHEFVAKSASYMDRSFEKVYNKTYTICLPYSTTVPDGMRAYQLNKKIEGGFYFLSVDNGVLEANQPYVLRVIDPTKSLSFVTETDATVPVTPTIPQQLQPAQDGLAFYGTTSNILNADAANKNYYNLSGGQWYGIKTLDGTTWNGGTTSRDIANGYRGYVHSMRAYVVTANTSGARMALMFDFQEEANATDISKVEKQMLSGNARIYTIDGRYAGTDFGSLPAGAIYVVDGKKVYKY